MLRTTVSRICRLLFLLLLAFSLFGAAPVLAQDGPVGDGAVPPEDGAVRPPAPGAVLDPASQQWMMPAEAAAAAEAAAGAEAAGAAIYGPDRFGYTYDDGAPYSWINPASGGTNAGLTGHDITGAVHLPFTFPFYENSYSNVYIASHGYLTFTGGQPLVDQSPMGDVSPPNNVIAPYWVPTDYSLGSTPIQVFYRTYGSAPNRSFVVQWNQLSDRYGTYTFEVILHENGSITFQYNLMNYGEQGYMCATSGIEDSRATDGLETMAFCRRQTSNRAIRFTRPANSARVLVNPAQFGQFISAGQERTITIPVINTGAIGADRFDIEYLPVPGWTMAFTNAATGAPLEDTNSSSWPDTGLLAMGKTFQLGVTIQAPPLLNVGDSGSIVFVLRSQLNAAAEQTVTISLALPSPFASTHIDGEKNTVMLQIMEPGRQASVMASTEYTNAFEPSVTETPNGNLLTVWSHGICLGSPCVYVEQLEYAVHDRTGRQVKRPSVLASLAGSLDNVYDQDPAPEAAPNGTLGVAWKRQTYGTNGQNNNIYFQRVSEAGALLGAPVRVTAINTYGTTNVYNPIIAATKDNRFIIAWRQVTGNVTDIYIAIYNTAGTRILAPKRITADTSATTDGFWTPAITALEGGGAMVAYGDWVWDCQYQVLNSSGTVAKAQTLLSGSYCSYPDLVQLSSGNILAAWESSTIPYALIDGSTFDVISTDNEFASYLPGYYPSVTRDGSGNGIITFLADEAFSPKRMYYAVVSDEGVQRTQPMVMLSNPVGIYSGYGATRTTTHSMPAQSDGVDLALSGRSYVIAPAGSVARVEIDLTNMGDEVASGATLNATLPPGLVLDSINLFGFCDAGICTWGVGDVGFMGRGKAVIYLALPDAPLGTAFDIDFSIQCTKVDVQPANNTRTVRVIVGEQVFSPYIQR